MQIYSSFHKTRAAACLWFSLVGLLASYAISLLRGYPYSYGIARNNFSDCKFIDKYK